MCLRHERLEKRHAHYRTPHRLGLNRPSAASRAGTDLTTNVQAVSRAVSYVNTHRPRFQVRARASYQADLIKEKGQSGFRAAGA